MKTFSMRPGDRERTVSVACEVCGSTADAPHWECDGFRFVRCRRCGHVYQNPQPVFDDLRNRYADQYFSYELENDANFFDLMIKGLNDVDFFDIEARLDSGRRFLDIGCATGMLLEYLKEREWQVQGVEICEPAARFGIEKRHVPIYIGTVEEAAFDAGSFSFVHFSHVIEHVPSPRNFLREVHRLLAPGGYVAVVTPTTDGLQAHLFQERWRSAIADHLNLFGARGLRSLLEETGFSVIRKKTWGGLAKGTAPPILKAPVDRLAKLFGFGDVMMYLARRNVARRNVARRNVARRNVARRNGIPR